MFMVLMVVMSICLIPNSLTCILLNNYSFLHVNYNSIQVVLKKIAPGLGQSTFPPYPK